MSLQLANEHREVIDGISTAAFDEIIMFLSAYVDASFDEIAQGIREGVPEILQAYNQLASQMAADYYDLTRKEASTQTGIHYNTYRANPNLVDEGFLAKSLSSGTGYALSGLSAGTMAFNSFQNAVLMAAQRNISDASRSTMLLNGQEDSDNNGFVRVPKAGACVWCKTKAGVISPDAEPTLSAEGFHGHCHCVLAATMKNQKTIQYRTKELEKFTKDREEARKLITEGKAPIRDLRTNNPQYKTGLTRQLKQKGFEHLDTQKSGLTKAQIGNRKSQVRNDVDSIVGKQVNGKAFTDHEKELLKTWGTTDKDFKVYKTPSLAEKDIMFVLRQEFGYK